MIDALQPYPDYRESGLLWLGKVPAHWQLRRMKFLLREVDARSCSGSEQLLRVSQYTGVTQRYRHAESGLADTRAESLVGYKKVSPLDLVVNIMLAWNGSMGVSRFEGIASPAYCVYRFGPSALPWYFNELLRSPMYKARIKTASNGVVESRLRLYSDDLGRIEALLPPPEEQAAIVRFLDYANGQLERAIRAKRRVIALLQEQKQAIIQRAVTRGLDPSVSLKQSGIPWIGRAPQHWRVTRVKNELDCLNTKRVPLSSVERGRMSRRDFDYYGASGVIDRVADYIFDDDLLLIAEDGANLVLRNLPLAIVARGKFWVNNHAHVLRPRHSSLVYLQAMLEGLSFRPWITGAAQPKLTKDRLMSIAIAVPPREEQEAIVNAFRHEVAPLERSIGSLQSEEMLLREYRTRLTADVVTGKLDVREVARKLPDEPRNTGELAADESEDQVDEEVVAE